MFAQISLVPKVDNTVPFNRPCIVGKELHYISEAIHYGHSAGNGPFTKRCSSLLERELGVSKVLLTTSCTAALEMAAMLLDIQPGDEVIVPAFTFVSTANAFAVRGARPVFADIHPDTLNLNEYHVERLITPRTRAIVPVHYAGVACNMDALTRISKQYGVPIVEDNAHGLFGAYKGRHLGSFGELGTLSFHETKNYICGEGGALLINNPDLIERAEVLWEKGTNRNRFFRGQVDKYTWVDIGSSFLPSDLLAAFLFAQLEERQKIQARRREIWCRYKHDLSEWADRQGVQIPSQRENCEQAYHSFHLIFPSEEERRGMIDHLKSRGVMSVFHYLPLHLSPMGLKFGGRPGDCPVTEWVSDRLLRLPFFNDLSDDEQTRVTAEVKAFKPLQVATAAPESKW